VLYPLLGRPIPAQTNQGPEITEEHRQSRGDLPGTG
jgi:hypothetical protein